MNSAGSTSSATSTTVHQWRHLAHRHQVGWGETLLIALNIHGVRTPIEGRQKIRLKVQPPEDEVYQLVVPSGQPTSPFTITDNQLCVDGTPVAAVVDVRADNAVSGYLRAAGTAATIHPGSDEASAEDGYARLLADLAISLPVGNTLADLQEVTVTGAGYESEEAAIADLATLRTAMSRLDMTARIGLLSSVVRTPEGMEALAERVAPFTLFADAEAPTDELVGMLAAARAAGHETSFTHTIGNDTLDVLRDHLLQLAQYTTVWPSLFILPTPSPDTDDVEHIAEPADRLDFFLQARTMLERIFEPTQLKPQPWRCYRGLWYREYAGEPLPGPWI
ncbi:hypothetical protein [Stackebrandtia soli]|uniref:hypothetical protein n=1 Tax=Stackebrandtia soli TaxID=1892856 RepID=UPI0039ED8C63